MRDKLQPELDPDESNKQVKLDAEQLSNHRYKGRDITLIPSLAAGEMWTCQYVISTAGQAEMNGFPIDTYSVRQDAASAALLKAKTLIDKTDLINSGAKAAQRIPSRDGS